MSRIRDISSVSGWPAHTRRILRFSRGVGVTVGSGTGSLSCRCGARAFAGAPGWRQSVVFEGSACPACLVSERSVLTYRTFSGPEGGRVRRSQRLQAAREEAGVEPPTPRRVSAAAALRQGMLREAVLADTKSSAAAIARRLGVSAGTVSRVRRGLVEEGLVPAALRGGGAAR